MVRPQPKRCAHSKQRSLGPLAMTNVFAQQVLQRQCVPHKAPRCSTSANWRAALWSRLCARPGVVHWIVGKRMYPIALRTDKMRLTRARSPG